MRLVVVTYFIVLICSQLSAQTIWFVDDFHRNDPGIQWKAATGDWRMKENLLQNASKNYDDLIASSWYAYANQSYSIEVTLRGIRAGVYFSLDDRSSKSLSHMVRFDEKSLLTGYFNAAGEFTATNTFDSPKIPVGWTTLRVDIDPGKNSYGVFVDGQFVGIDTSLVFPSGYIGLESSDGLSEFKSIRVFSDGPKKIYTMPKNGTKVSFAHLAYVHSHGSEIDIYQPEFKRMMRIDSAGTLLSSQALTEAPSLSKQIRMDGKTYSILGNRILIFTGDGALIDSITEHLETPSALASHSGKLYVADPGARVVFQYSPAGALQQVIDASAIGGFKAPRGIDIYGDNTLVVADYDKLLFWDEYASSPPLTAQGREVTTCDVSWASNVSTAGWLEVAADGGTWSRSDARAINQDHRYTVHLSGLTPLTRYSYRYAPALKTLPESFSASKVYRFSTPASDLKMTALTRLPVMCMIYRTISYRDKYPRDRYPQIPDGRSLDASDVEYVRQATQFNREFYFRNSGCKFVLDLDVYVVEDTLWLHEVGDSDPYWLSPNERVTRDFETAALAFGKKPDEYCGLICPYAWMNYPPRRTSALRDPSKKDSITIRQAVGGGTYGVPAPWKYGKTAGYTSNPFQDRFSRQDWLITHEFHHQIDALMEASGYPEYYHADQPWKMAGRFGEDFDFNAKIIRNAGRDWWLNLRFGKLYATRDADSDGVPDDDSSLPFDEKRLGGNPGSQDTDGDGVSDLAEVMMGSSRSSSLINKDTDSDGMQDNIDPEPLYPINPAIAKVTNENELDLHPFGSIHSPSVNARFFLAWKDSALLLSALTDKPSNLLFQIDADNDGWFHGFDNFQIRVLNNGDSAKVADFYLRDCSSWVNSPKDRRDILHTTDLVLKSEKLPQLIDSMYRYKLTLRIPRNDSYGFQLVRDKKFSIRMGVQTTTDLWVWEELFERNYMMQVELK